MTETLAITLPIPRVVVGIKRRARVQEPERLCVLDDVPVLVRAPSPDEAPVSLVVGHAQYRSFDGALYRPLFGHYGEGCTPGKAAEVLRARGNHIAGDGGHHDWRDSGEMVVDIYGTFEGARRDRGLRSVEGHQLREIADDGLAAQRSRADAVAEKLVVLDGTLWHRCPVPVLQVSVTGRSCDPDEAMAGVGAHVWESLHEEVSNRRYRRDLLDREEYKFGHGPWLEFPVERQDDLIAFCKSLLEQPWHGRGRFDPGNLGRIKVADEAALKASSPPETPAAFLARATRHFLRASIRYLDELPAEAVEAYARARTAADALARGLDPDEGYERIKPFVEALDELLAPRLADRGMNRSDDDLNAYEDAAEGVHAARALRLRYEMFESPRPHLHEGRDFADLAGLAR